MEVKMKYYSFNNVASVYDKTRSIPQKLVDKFLQEVIFYLQNIFKKTSYQVLSLGLGTGRIEAQLSSQNLQLFGIDISELMIQELRNKSMDYTPFVSIGNVTSLPFRKKFHASLAIHIVHMIKNYKELLKETQKVSKSLIFGDAYTAAYDNPIYIFFKKTLEKNSWKEKTRGFTCNEFKDFLIAMGYEVDTKEYTTPTQIPKNEIYESIRKKHFSSFWDIPDSIYKKSLFDLKSKIEKEKISINGYYNTNSYLKLNFVRF